MPVPLKFSEIITINGNKLTKKYIESLSKKERLDLVDPIFDRLRETGFIYMDDVVKIEKSWKRLLDYEPDLSKDSVFNNSSLGTDICKFFCHSFYETTERGKATIIDNFYNDDKLKRLIINRLGLDWLDSDERGPGVNEAFNLSFKMIVFQGQRSMRMVNATSMFKPTIAKYVCRKYSNKGDVVYDYSAGFGGRMLGTLSCGRKYIGADPLTIPELKKMADFFKLEASLISGCSEDIRLIENSVDLCWSSPPYYDQEFYSENSSQAYNKGEDYFYNTYWKNTLENAEYMLKPGKWFGLNVKNYPKMLDMAINCFGDVKEKVALKTVRSHLNKSAGTIKNEYIYMFMNNK